jgi:hypothetical protein
MRSLSPLNGHPTGSPSSVFRNPKLPPVFLPDRNHHVIEWFNR